MKIRGSVFAIVAMASVSATGAQTLPVEQHPSLLFTADDIVVMKERIQRERTQQERIQQGRIHQERTQQGRIQQERSQRARSQQTRM